MFKKLSVITLLFVAVAFLMPVSVVAQDEPSTVISESGPTIEVEIEGETPVSTTVTTQPTTGEEFNENEDNSTPGDTSKIDVQSGNNVAWIMIAVSVIGLSTIAYYVEKRYGVLSKMLK